MRKETFKGYKYTLTAQKPRKSNLSASRHKHTRKGKGMTIEHEIKLQETLAKVMVDNPAHRDIAKRHEQYAAWLKELKRYRDAEERDR